MHIKDATGREVLRMERPLKIPFICGIPPCCATFLCCVPEVTITTVEGYVARAAAAAAAGGRAGTGDSAAAAARAAGQGVRGDAVRQLQPLHEADGRQ